MYGRALPDLPQSSQSFIFFPFPRGAPSDGFCTGHVFPNDFRVNLFPLPSKRSPKPACAGIQRRSQEPLPPSPWTGTRRLMHGALKIKNSRPPLLESDPGMDAGDDIGIGLFPSAASSPQLSRPTTARPSYKLRFFWYSTLPCARQWESPLGRPPSYAQKKVRPEIRNPYVFVRGLAE